MLQRLADELDAPQKVVRLALGIAPATLKRRRESGYLRRAENDRVYRFTDIFQRAIQLVEGDEALAREWLESWHWPFRASSSRSSEISF